MKKVNLKYLFKVSLLAVCILSVGGAASAQESNSSQQAKITVPAEQAKAIKKIEEAKTLADKIKATNDFLKKYPDSPARAQAADYLAGEIAKVKDDAQIIQNGETYLTIFTEPADTDLIYPSLIYSYVAAKRGKDAYAAGEKYLSRHADDVTIRVKLAIEGSNLLRTGTKDYAAPSREYAAQAIALIEGDKKPATMEAATWQEYRTKWLPQLYQTLGIFDFYADAKPKARVSLEKATTLDSSDINSWLLLSSIADDEYQDVAMRYNAATDAVQRADLLKQANEKMDLVIEMYARIVALTESKPEAKQINEQIRQNLESYYKYRHKNLDGLPALIAKYKK